LRIKEQETRLNLREHDDDDDDDDDVIDVSFRLDTFPPVSLACQGKRTFMRTPKFSQHMARHPE